LYRREDCFFTEYVAHESANPVDLLSELCGDSASASNFLFDFGPDPVAIVLPGPMDQVGPWAQFINQILHLQKSAHPAQRPRYLVIVMADGRLPPEFLGPSSRVYRLWNAFRWEDARLLAGNWIGHDKTEATRAWMLATYV